jgi:ketosteroid isomerase-like protein
MESPDLAIRLRRAAFNRAIAEADLAAIGQFLTINAVLVAGTDSALVSGSKAQVLVWKREFASADRTIYTRLPAEIEVSAVAPIALEHGRWQGVTLSGIDLASGSYAAKWRQTGGEWLIEAEIYLTLA